MKGHAGPIHIPGRKLAGERGYALACRTPRQGRSWEGIWHVVEKVSEIQALLKGLILLLAAGVKVGEGKRTAAMRHAGRATGLFQYMVNVQHHDFERTLAIQLGMLA